MRTIFRVQILRSTVFAAAVVAGVFLLNTGSISAHEGEDHSEQSAHTYTAKAGDSQTIFARDAINSYAKDKDIKLSNEGRIYAETNLVKKMGDRYLEIGEKVAIDQSDVKSVIDSADKLTTSEKAAWQPYAATVDFSTETLSNLTGEPGESSASSTDDADVDKEDKADDKNDESDKKDKESENSPWYTNVFTWILIVAAAIIVWSLFASRKDEK